MHNLDKIKESDTISRASLRSTNRRNAVTITRSSSLSPTPIVVDSDTQSLHNSQKTSPRNSPTQFLDDPAFLLRSDSLPSNHVHRRSPVLTKQVRISSRESPTKEMRNSNDIYFVPIQHATSTLSTNSYSSANSYNSSNGQNPSTGSPSTIKRSKSVVHNSTSANQDGTGGGQRVSNSVRNLLTTHNIVFSYSLWC